MRIRFSAIALVLLCVFQCRAQPLADHLPADTILYAGWSGVEKLGPGFDDSHFKAVLDASSVHELINEFLPAVTKKVAESNPDAAQALPMVTAVLQPMWKYPTAIYFGGVEFGQGPPMPKFAILIEAKDQADAVLQGLSNPLAIAQQAQVPINAKNINGVVVVSVGPIPAALEATIKQPGANSLADNADFKTTMAQLTPQPVMAAYLSGAKLWAAVDQGIATLSPGLSGGWGQIKASLALDGVKSIGLAGGFDGKNWGLTSVLWAPAPRNGLAAQMQTAPLSEDVFKLVPQSSTYMTAMQFDLGKLVQSLRLLAMFKPEINDQINQAFQMVNSQLGFDVQTDFFNAFGSEWLAYTDPQVGGNSAVGTVLINRATDAAKLEKSLTKLEQLANTLIAENNKDPKIHLSLTTKEIDGTTVHYLAIPLITPSWAIRDGKLYVGIYPQPVMAAASFGNKKGPSILDNEKFQALRKHFGATQVTSCTYVDLPALVPENYAAWTAISRLVGFGDIFGVPAPLTVLPSLKTLMDNIEPAGQASWSDDFGFHFRAMDPFPGSELLAANPAGGIGGAALLASVSLPSLSRARNVADRTKSATNLRTIGQGCILYANDNNGKLPDDLATLYQKEDLGLNTFVAPYGHSGPMPSRGTAQELGPWVNEHSDYIYKGAGKNMKEMTSDKVLAYEKPEIAQREHGMNVLYGDGHVEWLTSAQAHQLLDANQ
jgi:prepilin-type processing-associated H-X9-DG protein